MLTEKQLNTGEVDLNYVEGSDEGPPIVFIHGIGGRWQAWSQEIGLVAHAWRPIAVDLRGHGKSSAAESGYGFDDYPRDIIALLESLDGEPSVLVGHSLGAVTAAGVASARPDLVRAAVLEDPPLYVNERGVGSPRRGVFARMQELAAMDLPDAEMFRLVMEADPDQTQAQARSRVVSLKGLDPAVYTRALNGTAMADFDTGARLAAIKCPVLLIQADPSLGAAMSDEDGDRAAAAIPDCAFVRMRGVGHGIHRDDPINFRRALFDFLDSL